MALDERLDLVSGGHFAVLSSQLLIGYRPVQPRRILGSPSTLPEGTGRGVAGFRLVTSVSYHLLDSALSARPANGRTTPGANERRIDASVTDDVAKTDGLPERANRLLGNPRALPDVRRLPGRSLRAPDSRR